MLTLVLLATLSLALPALAQDPLIESVCLITDVGRVNDGTFNQFAYKGMTDAVEEFDLDSTYIETTSQVDYAMPTSRPASTPAMAPSSRWAS